MKRWISSFLIFFLGSIPACAFAVGFGEIKLHSYLNDPLDAEIELLGTESYDTDRLLVSLASAQEFKRAGLERPFFLTEFRFQVLRKNAHTSIRITSKNPIKQPFLDFLIDLSWPGGRLVRGYTLLLDPAPIESGRLHEKYSDGCTTGVLGPTALPLDPEMLAALEGPPPLNEINESNITSILSPETLAKNSNTVKLLSSEKLNESSKSADTKLQGVGLLTAKPKNSNTSNNTVKSKEDDSATYVPLSAGKSQTSSPSESTQSNASAQYEPLFEPDKTEKKYPLPSMTVVSNDGTSFSNEAKEAKIDNPNKINTPTNSAHSETSNHPSSNIPPITLITPSNPQTILQVNFNVKQMLLVVICLLMLFGGIVGTLQLLKRRRQPMHDAAAEDILASITGLNNGLNMQPSFASTPAYQRSTIASAHPSVHSSAQSPTYSSDYHEAAINKLLEGGEAIDPSTMMDQNWLMPGLMSEEVALKLNLARQYLDMGDSENALSLLNKILSQGSDEEKEAARNLLNAFN